MNTSGEQVKCQLNLLHYKIVIKYFSVLLLFNQASKILYLNVYQFKIIDEDPAFNIKIT